MTTRLIFGCGYLGRRVADAWLTRGDRVFAVTRSAERAVSWQDAGLRPIVADICDPASLADLPDVDTVLYAVGYDRSSGRSRDEVMLSGLQNVLDRMRDRCRRFVFISSSSVYGQSDGEWVDETSRCQPTQPGGECCLAAEKLVAEAFADRPVAWQILRLSGIYGPGRLLSKIETLRSGTPLAGRPDAWLNLIHVDDAVQAVLACETRAQSGMTCLVSDDRPALRREYYSHLAAVVDAPPPTFDESQPAARGSGGVNKRCRNVRMHDELGVTLRYPTFVEGLAASMGATG